MHMVFFGGLAVGDVCIGTDDAHRHPVGVPFDAGAAALYPDPVAVDVAFAILEGIVVRIAGILPFDAVDDVLPVIGVYDFQPGLRVRRDRPARPDAANGAPGVRIEHCAGLRKHVPHAGCRAGERVVPAAFTGDDLRLAALAVGDVGKLHHAVRNLHAPPARVADYGGDGVQRRGVSGRKPYFDGTRHAGGKHGRGERCVKGASVVGMHEVGDVPAYHGRREVSVLRKNAVGGADLAESIQHHGGKRRFGQQDAQVPAAAIGTPDKRFAGAVRQHGAASHDHIEKLSTHCLKFHLINTG